MLGALLTYMGVPALNPVAYLATLIGTTEPALKLLLSIFMSYPIAVFYHKHVKQNFEYRNIYFILTGMGMAYYNFGVSMYNNAIPAIVIYFTTKHLGMGQLNILVTFVFNMAYLVVGYMVTESEDYDITWTMPQCVLALKLIALSFDLSDSVRTRSGEQVSSKSYMSYLQNEPTFMELIGFVYFPAGFLVGPIFSFRRYRDFLTDQYPLNVEASVYQREAMKRLILGFVYLIAYQVGVSVFSMKYIQSEEFWNTSIFYRHIYCGLWAHFALYKYISCWLLTEASCIRFGLSYDGRLKVGPTKYVSQWDACTNIKLLRFEGATRFQHYIDSFNCNTNHFAAEYVYKRLKFLGNRNLSQLFTLLFLALWHGTRSGYYMTFFNEFMIILMEKELEAILVKTRLYHAMWNNNICKYILYAILKMYTLVFMGWSLVPFDVKGFSKWWNIYYSLYFSGFILFLPWAFVYKPILMKIAKFFEGRTKTQ